MKFNVAGVVLLVGCGGLFAGSADPLTERWACPSSWVAPFLGSVVPWRGAGPILEATDEPVAPSVSERLAAMAELVPQLKQIFTEAGIPPGLVWIAEVESGWDARARSRTGAVGLFQFKPEAAVRFGLLVGGTDNRTNPLYSASAAAAYLRLLHQQFGSWQLAIAAYNAGEGCVSRALLANNVRTYEEVAAFLPLETQDYVPRVMDLMLARQSALGLNAGSKPLVSIRVADGDII